MNPSRGEPVFHGTPKWLRGALNANFQQEIQSLYSKLGHRARRAKLGSLSEVETFILNSDVCEDTGIFDHWGRDAAENFVCEPYAVLDAETSATVAAFAARLGVACSITTPAYHHPACIRITFFKPVQG